MAIQEDDTKALIFTVKSIKKNALELGQQLKILEGVIKEISEVERIKSKANRDIFGYCLGCSPDICNEACSEDNNFNIPF